jgi:2-polyprenyl-6-methoxyphenol hydroxylase-like FAD-dependent oxidoreductase
MGGAYLLARALHEAADYQDAFHRYEQQMSAYVRAQQKSARNFAKSFLPGSPLGLFIQQTMMKVLFRPTFRGLLRRQFVPEGLLPPQETSPVQLAVQQEGLPHG